jgi:hypothetical protein
MSTGLEEKPRRLLGITHDCQCWAVGIRLPACPARTANDIAARLRSVPVWVAADRVRGAQEESTPHHAATARGRGAGAVVVASRGCRVKGP